MIIVWKKDHRKDAYEVLVELSLLKLSVNEQENSGVGAYEDGEKDNKGKRNLFASVYLLIVNNDHRDHPCEREH